MFASKDTLLTRPSGGYNIARSVRLRSSASAYFNRTPSASSRTTWTWSAWVKRGKLGSAQALFSAGTGTAEFRLTFTSSDTIEIYEYTSPSYNWQKITTAVYRDPSAWYHIQLTYDTTNGTAGDRVKLYVNGVQVTSFGTNTNPTSSFSGYVNSAVAHGIGSFSTGSSYLDGYLTEINFIDGQALTPSSFGKTDAVTGQWIPKKFASTYGTNGFYLKFADASAATAAAIGKDSSPNGNNWTPNNISVTAGTTYDAMIDSPSLSAVASNFTTLNPLSSGTSTNRLVLSNGNLTATSPVGNYQLRTNPTIFSSSGKFYCEVVFTAGYSATDGTLTTGFISASAGDRSTNNNSLGYENTGAIGYLNNGSIYVNNSVHAASATYATYTTNNVIMLAIDMDNQKVYVGKDGTWQNSGNPAAGTGSIYSGGVLASGMWGFSASGYGSNPASSFTFNFGAGSGFTYTPPSGFKSLNTYNLP
jgi:hypothetical protein